MMWVMRGKRENVVYSGVCIVSVILMMSAGPALMDAQSIVARNEASVVVVFGTRDEGPVQSSGCFVSTSGIVLTTAHQVTGVADLRVRLRDGKEAALKLLALDEVHELALLQADVEATQPATIGDLSSLSAGAPLISIAAPRNLAMSAVDGIVSNMERTYRGYRVIQTNLPAEPGSSGGPVFDARGGLVGVIVGRLEEQAWVTLVNPINNAYSLLNAHGVPCPGRVESAGGLDDMESEIVPAPDVGPVEREAIQAYNRGCQAKDAGQKMAAYSAAAKLLPQFYEAWFNLGCASTAAGDPARALEAYETARMLRPRAAEPLRNGGRVLLLQGRLADAASWFEAGVRAAPEDASFRNDLGETWRRMGKTEQAIAALREAVRLKPEFAAAVYNLALALADAGRTEAAVLELERYLVLAPDAPDAGQVRQWLARLRAGRPGEN